MGFINCQFGLANDIMNSGEMFAEFKGAFFYFKKHWWQFFILTIFIYGIGGIIQGPFLFMTLQERIQDVLPLTLIESIFLNLGRNIIQWIWLVIWIHSFPAVTFHNDLFKGIRESFQIIKANPKWVLKTWGIYFLIFRLPLFLLEILGLVVRGYPTLEWIFYTCFSIIILALIFVGNPLMSLIATGIYNNSSVKNEQNEQKANTIDNEQPNQSQESIYTSDDTNQSQGG
jgi:hypothetical protein